MGGNFDCAINKPNYLDLYLQCIISVKMPNAGFY